MRAEADRGTQRVGEARRDDASRAEADRGMGRVGEAEAMSEVVYSVLPCLHVTDSTEQIFVYIFVRLLATLDETDWSALFGHVWRRVLVSFVTHQVMTYLVHTFPMLNAPSPL